jgi:hypothetical protein
MKNKIKQNYKKVVLSLVTTSIGVTSCNLNGDLDDNLKEEEERTIGFTINNFAKDEPIGTNLLPISLYVGKEYNTKIKFIDSFVNNILSNHSEALKFKENPCEVLSKYNIENMPIDKNSPEIQILFALADSEILKAIEDNDVKAYFELLKKKNLFQTDKFKKMVSIYEANEKMGANSKGASSVNQEEVISPVAICFLGVAIYVALATVAETYVMAHHKFAMWGGTIEEVRAVANSELIDENVMKLWSLKGNIPNTYDLNDPQQNSIIETSFLISESAKLTESEREIVTKISLGTIEKYKN